MQYAIHSRKLGQTLTFSRPGGHYIFVDLNSQPGTLGDQICEGGHLRGSTLTCTHGDQAAFERICQRWYRAYLRHQ